MACDMKTAPPMINNNERTHLTFHSQRMDRVQLGKKCHFTKTVSHKSKYEGALITAPFKNIELLT